MLLSKTTELAILSMLILSQKPPGYLINPAEIAKGMNESEAYISKVLRLLAQGGLLRSRRGIGGGFELLREPKDVTLLDIVEVSQGTIPGNYCGRSQFCEVRFTCGYHQAMYDLRQSTREALGRWTLARVLKVPRPKKEAAGCMMRKVRSAGGAS